MTMDYTIPIELWQVITNESNYLEQVRLSQLCEHFYKTLKFENKYDELSRYFFLQDKYTKLLGDKAIVLRKVGCFYNVYKTNVTGCKLGTISNITGFVITGRYRNDLTFNKNYYMIGIPGISLTKNATRLKTRGYTIMLVEYKENEESITVYDHQSNDS